MSDLLTRILIGGVALGFILVSVFLTKPESNGGRLSRKLCIANAVGWLLILPLPSSGHPPPWLIPMILFWLANLVLVPAAFFALWNSHKEREEKLPFVAVGLTYIALNLVVLFVVPFAWVLIGAFG